jgi:hypothetical protein
MDKYSDIITRYSKTRGLKTQVDFVTTPRGGKAVVFRATDFGKRLKELGGKIVTNFESIMQQSATEIHMELVKSSPVDSGAYRASHKISTTGKRSGHFYSWEDRRASKIAKSEEEEIAIRKENKGIALEKVMEYRDKFVFKAGNIILIYNNVPYSQHIENGDKGNKPVYKLLFGEIKEIFDKNVRLYK